MINFIVIACQNVDEINNYYIKYNYKLHKKYKYLYKTIFFEIKDINYLSLL